MAEYDAITDFATDLMLSGYLSLDQIHEIEERLKVARAKVIEMNVSVGIFKSISVRRDLAVVFRDELKRILPEWVEEIENAFQSEENTQRF